VVGGAWGGAAALGRVGAQSGGALPPAGRVAPVGAACAAAVGRGLEAARKALALNPRLAEAERLQGTLELAAAREAGAPGARREAAARANAALTRAVALDPLLRPRIAPLLGAAAALAAAAPPS